MDNNNAKIGRGSGDIGAYHRALDLARQLEAAGLRDGQGLIVIHNAYNTHRKVQNTPVVMVIGSTRVHAGIKDLVQGQDYESSKESYGFAARPASSGPGFSSLTLFVKPERDAKG